MANERRFGRVAALLTVAWALAGASALAGAVSEEPTRPPAASAAVARLIPKVVATKPHDPRAFTQGLAIEGGVLYESTGLYRDSSLRRYQLAADPAAPRELARIALDPTFFGEGLALADGRLFVLTWQNGVALVYDPATLTLLQRIPYDGEGWGLAFDGVQLIQSDGSARLRYRDPQDFRLQGTLEVTLDGRPLDRLNELEFVEGRLYANVWGEDWLVRIDPATGKVDALIDASGLLQKGERRGVDVLNGIAWDPARKTFWMTGKLWPKLFEVELVPAPKP